MPGFALLNPAYPLPWVDPAAWDDGVRNRFRHAGPDPASRSLWNASTIVAAGVTRAFDREVRYA